MGMLKERSTANIVAIIVIIIGTLFGVHRSIARETRKTEAMFYDGVYIKDEGYLQPGIGEQLEKRETAALGLITIASRYDALSEMTESLRQARLELLDAGSIHQKYAANQKLQAAYEAIFEKLILLNLTESEDSAAENYAATMDGAQGVIQKSAYNEAAAAFRRELSAFPVNILKRLVFAPYPEYFGAEE